MADFTYTTVPGKLKSLLAKLREVGVPPKATVQWLKSIGFRSSNDPSMLPVLRQIGFIDASSVPQDHWRHYRGAQHKQVLANALRVGYADLFAVYPDANTRSSSDMEHVVTTSSSAGKQAISKTVSTFQNLCAEGDFAASGGAPPPPPRPPAGSSGGAPPATPPAQGGGDPVPSLHIDIQVHISPDATPEQIDKIFESMAKHLYAIKK